MITVLIVLVTAVAIEFILIIVLFCTQDSSDYENWSSDEGEDIHTLEEKIKCLEDDCGKAELRSYNFYGDWTVPATGLFAKMSALEEHLKIEFKETCTERLPKYIKKPKPTKSWKLKNVRTVLTKK